MIIRKQLVLLSSMVVMLWAPLGSPPNSLATPSKSAAPPEGWVRTYGRETDDFYAVSAMAPGRNGRIWVVGHSAALGAYDLWMAQLAANGAVINQRSLGGAGNTIDEATSIQVLPDGSAVVVGSTEVTSNGVSDAWVLKVKPDGTPDWQYTYGGSNLDQAADVLVTSDNALLVVGTTWSYGGSNGNVWVLKLDMNGGLIWQTVYGSDRMEAGLSVIQIGPAEYRVFGTSGFPAFPSDILMLTVSLDGTLSHPRLFGNLDTMITEGVRDARSTAGTGFVLAGYSSANFGLTNAWIAKYDAADELTWSYVYAQENCSSDANSVQPTQDGGYLVSGSVNCGDADDAFVAKLTSAGELAWQRKLGQDGHGERFLATLELSDQSLMVAGYMGNDAAVIKLNGPDYLAGCSLFSTSHLSRFEASVSLTIAADVVGQTSTAARALANPTLGTTPPNMQLYCSAYATPQPFLDLPIPYDGSSVTFYRTLQDSDVTGGRITSWFDHKFPKYGFDDGTGLWIYTGPHTNRATAYWAGKRVLCFDRLCYDGHDGIDFTPEVVGKEGLEIRAAADGIVAATKPECPPNDPIGCDGGFGKYVVVYHALPGINGYFTLYGHLSDVNVAAGDQVDSGQKIGAMGNTGNSSGAHLHFGVYRDDGDGAWKGFSTDDKPVDPFGYRTGPVGQPDPWAKSPQTVSYPLWINNPITSGSTSGQAITLVGATQNVTVIVPANRFPGQATLELLLGPVAGPLAQLRQAGQSFWLTMVEWIQGVSVNPGSLPADIAAAAEPITVSVQYGEAQSRHLDMSQAAIYRWDDVSATWLALPTTLNAQTRTLTGLSPDVGQFSPQAPLLCPADTAEPDDDLYRASVLSLGSASTSHVFDSATDEDWFVWDAQANVPYVIRTQGLAAGVDTVLEIRDVSGQNVLATDDNSGGGVASRIERSFTAAGTYFARVTPKAGSAAGCVSTYQVSAFIPRVFLPGLSR